jgi:hypothetical protein
MGLLRRVAIVATSFVALAAVGVGVAGAASAASESISCVYATPGHTGGDYCVYFYGYYRVPVPAANEEGYYLTPPNFSTYARIQIEGLPYCIQAEAQYPTNGGWGAYWETCNGSTGQGWWADPGPDGSWYYLNEYDPAYCLSWDENGGIFFTGVCKFAWYQQFYNFY